MSLSDRKTIRQAIGKDNSWLITGATNDTAGNVSSIIDSTIYSSVRDQHVRARDVVSIIESGDSRRGERRLATGPPTSAGLISVSPDFGGTIGNAVDYEIWKGDGPHPDEIDRCIDKALAEACWYWKLSPVTMLRSGDSEEDLSVNGANLEDADGNVLWTGTNVTPAQPSLEYPEEYIRRVIQITAGASPGYTESPVIEVDNDERNWRVFAFVRAFSGDAGAGEARLVLVDKTNSTTFATATDPLYTDTRGWRLLKSNFTIPVNCHQIALRLQVQTSGDIGQFGAIQLLHKDRNVFSMERRVTHKKQVGSLLILTGDDYRQLKRQQWGGHLERREVAGRGVSLEIDPVIGENMLWFYERTGYPALTVGGAAGVDDDEETWSALEWVKTAASFYVYEYLSKRDRVVAPDRWRNALRDARELLEVIQEDYGIEPMHVEDSPQRTRRAMRRV